MFENWPNANKGPYIYIPDSNINIISIFDDLKYDRSDADMVAPAMRHHIVEKLQSLGFKQVSGNVIEHSGEDIRCIIPKSHALAASSFHITDYTPKREQDYYILTPTQTACQFINIYSLEEALDKISLLVARQPINLFRLKDYLESNTAHEAFLEAIPHLKYLQRMAVESDQLKGLRALK